MMTTANDVPTPNVLRRRAVVTCIVTTVTIAAVEIAAGWHFKLISITAEGLHTAADLVDSLVAFVLLAIAAKPADRDHPYGHGKFDSLAAIIEGGCVGISAVWAIVKATHVLLGRTPADPHPGAPVMIAMAIASVVYFGVSRYVLRLARRTGSPAVLAEGLHLRTHVYITAGLLVGLAATWLGMARGWAHAERIDALAALVLGVVLLAVAYRIVRAGYRQLVDTSLPTEELDEITDCLNQFSRDFVEVHAIRTRRAGTERHVDIHLVVEGDLSVRAAHDLSHRIEAALQSQLPEIHLLVHTEPAIGEALEAYQARSGLGKVMDNDDHPAERERTHHDDDTAHQAKRAREEP